MSLIVLQNGRSSLEHLASYVFPKIDAEGRSKPCGGKKRPYKVCQSEMIFPILKGQAPTRRLIYKMDFLLTILIMLLFLFDCK